MTCEVSARLEMLRMFVVFADDVFAVNGDKDYEDVSDHEHMLEGVHFVVDIQGQ